MASANSSQDIVRTRSNVAAMRRPLGARSCFHATYAVITAKGSEPNSASSRGMNIRATPKAPAATSPATHHGERSRTANSDRSCTLSFMRSLWAMSCQEPVELVREALAIGVVERRRAAGALAGAAQLIEVIAQREALLDVLRGIELAARIERVRALGDHVGGERNVGGDHEIARRALAHDVAVRDVDAMRHLQRADVRRRRRAQELVRHQRERNLRALRRAVENVLDDRRTRVGVDPDVHAPNIAASARALRVACMHDTESSLGGAPALSPLRPIARRARPGIARRKAQHRQVDPRAPEAPRVAAPRRALRGLL